MPFADRAPIDRQPEPFDPNNLRRSVIAVPLREAIEQELDATNEFAEQHAELLKGHSATVLIQVLVAIDPRAAQRLAKEEAKAAARRVKETLRGAGKSGVPEPRRDPAITPAEAKRCAAVKLAAEEKKLTARFRTIHHILPDFKLRSCITQSISTVKADAAHRSFTASGKGITWAVMDSGIDGTHPHFRLHKTVDLASTYHKDFTSLATPGSALRDEYGHGTHVSGIIAGEQSFAKGAKASEMVCVWRELDEVDAEQGEPSDADEPQPTTKQITECNYFETSGTSMAAPHVSGAIAAFLAIRKEFTSAPERVKKIFTSTATDLGCDRYFQGSGLVDLMRAIQSV